MTSRFVIPTRTDDAIVERRPDRGDMTIGARPLTRIGTRLPRARRTVLTCRESGVAITGIMPRSARWDSEQRGKALRGRRTSQHPFSGCRCPRATCCGRARGLFALSVAVVDADGDGHLDVDTNARAAEVGDLGSLPARPDAIGVAAAALGGAGRVDILELDSGNPEQLVHYQDATP